VRILFDANTPAPFAKSPRGHQISRADQLGRQGLENGELLDVAEQAGFDILLTCDQNVPFSKISQVEVWRLLSCPLITGHPY
jgi:hypothetical protein